MQGDDEDAPTVEGTPPTAAERYSKQRLSQPRLADRYRVVDTLGQGGMGEVLDARDLQIGRDVAVKCMKAEEPSDRAIQRFLREAKIQGRLEHPAIVPVHELGRGPDGRPFFAMKKLAGTTLAKLVRQDTPRQRLLRAFLDVCLAVEFAHTRGFVHRDLKPDNIMLGDFGETYVLDWGIAKVLGTDDDLDPADTETVATQAGAVLGTPGYMSPEQAHGLAIDARSDVYSLGCVLFEILTGERLHTRGQALDAAERRPSVRSSREIPIELDELVVLATELDPDARIATARQLADAVQQFLDGDRDLARRRELAAAHVAAAQTALAADDHPAATREAGRALALDPMQRTAADVLASSLLSPPKVMPAEVRASLDEENRLVIRRTATAGWIVSVGYILVALVLAVATPAPMRLFVPMFAVSIANAYLLFQWTRKTTFWPHYAVLITSSLMVAVSCRMGSPVYIGPGLAAVTALGLMAGAQFNKRDIVFVFGATVMAVLVPWAGERLGWWSATMRQVGDDLVIDAPFLTGGAIDHVWFVVITCLIVGAAIMFTRGIRISERTAREQLHLITWQLRHLVPR